MKKPVARAAAKSGGWRVAIWLLLAAFTLQAYVAQTHIHDAAPTSLSQTGITKSVSASDSKAPSDKSQPDCPFCQAVAQAGAFHLPGAPLIFLTASFITVMAPGHPAPASYDATAHNWRSRAPPLP